MCYTTCCVTRWEILVSSVFATLMSPYFLAEGQHLQLTPSLPVIEPWSSVPTKSSNPMQTLNCSLTGTRADRDFSLRLSVRQPSPSNGDPSASSWDTEKANLASVTFSLEGVDRRTADDSAVAKVTWSKQVTDGGLLSAYMAVELAGNLCGSAGLYRCQALVLDQYRGGQAVDIAPPASASVTVSKLPGGLSLTAAPDPDPGPSLPLALASVLTLTCRGWAGLRPDDVDIQWQWAAVDSGPGDPPPDKGLNFTSFVPTAWDKVTNITVTDRVDLSHPAPDTALCRSPVVQSILVRTLTETDRYRTYRCLPSIKGRTLVDRAATYRVRIKWPGPTLVVMPEKLELGGHDLGGQGSGIQLVCQEEARPMDTVMHVRIELFHDNGLTAVAESGLDIDCPRSQLMISELKQRILNSTTARNSYPTNDTKRQQTGNSSDAALNADPSEDVRRDMPELRYNVHVGSCGPLFLSVKTSRTDCSSKGRYRCVLTYTLHVPGGQPVTLAQAKDVLVSARVSQQPVMTVSGSLLQYPVGSRFQATCSAYMDGPQQTARWRWQICRFGCMSLGCKPAVCAALRGARVHQKKTAAGDCQYRQSTSLYVTVGREEAGGFQLRCHVIRGGTASPPAVTNFTVIGKGSVLHALASKAGGSGQYNNLLLSLVLPTLLLLCVVVVASAVLYLTWGRFRRLQRRLHMTVFRRGRGRTNHFRKRPRKAAQSTREQGRLARVMTFCRAAYSVLMDRPEIEFGKQETQLYEPYPRQRQRQRRRRRRRMDRPSYRTRSVHKLSGKGGLRDCPLITCGSRIAIATSLPVTTSTIGLDVQRATDVALPTECQDMLPSVLNSPPSQLTQPGSSATYVRPATSKSPSTQFI